jgi:hypothetical protein
MPVTFRSISIIAIEMLIQKIGVVFNTGSRWKRSADCLGDYFTRRLIGTYAKSGKV